MVDQRFQEAVQQVQAQAPLKALQHRAQCGLLSQTVFGPSRHPENFQFWQGYAKALRDLADGTADRTAARDAELGGYRLPGAFRAAASVLGADVYRLSRADICDRLAQAGVKHSLHPVTAQDLPTAVALEDCAVPAFDGDRKQITSDDEDCACSHTDVPARVIEADIVKEMQ